MLDSTAPSRRRGKEREVAKSKKPSKLKRVILSERKHKKMLRGEGTDDGQEPGTKDSAADGDDDDDDDDDGSESDNDKDAADDHGNDGSPGDEAADDTAPATASAAAASAAAASAAAEEDEEAAAAEKAHEQEALVLRERFPAFKRNLHSRKFREYCFQALNPELDALVIQLLQKLYAFQLRQHLKDAIKAMPKRRYVIGIREVQKLAQKSRIKCVLMAPDIERIQADGGLDEQVLSIIELCSAQNVPVIFTLSRRKLGAAMFKSVPVSMVGIINYQSLEDIFKPILELATAARDKYELTMLAASRTADTPAASAEPVTA